MADEGFHLTITGLTQNRAAVEKAFRQFLKRLEGLGHSVAGSIQPVTAAELHGTTDAKSTQGP